MKIALVHDHLLEFGGAERVFVMLKKIFPDADVFVAAYDGEVAAKHIPDFDEWKRKGQVHVSWAAYIPFFKKLYSPLRFLAPYIWESFNFSKYDVVISSSGWFMSKGIITRPETVHICYLHHQPRYLYYYETSMNWQKYWPIRIYGHVINHFLRMWDFEASQRPDVMLVNSEETNKRLKKFYRRDDGVVVYPPVHIPTEVDEANFSKDARSYYVTLSRLQKAKNVDLLIRAANKMKIKLKIIGAGKDEEYLRSIAGPTVEILGRLPDNDLKNIMNEARGFLFASVDEEFGIAPVEGMGYGIPVIAYASGGLKETIQNGENGFLYEELTENALLAAIQKLEHLSEAEYHKMCVHARKKSEGYSEDVFEKHILKIVDSA